MCPRHAKEYRDFKTEYARLHDEAVAAFKEFKEDVTTHTYPSAKHSVEMKIEEYEAFKKVMDGL